MRFFAGFIFGALLICNGAWGQTNWSVPIAVTTTNETSATLLSAPRVATGLNGEVALLYFQHSTITTGTAPHIVPWERHSDVLVKHSHNFGETWGSSRQISDPSVLSGQGRAITDSSGNFYFVWTSGDPLSGFRLHTATTSNNGISYTSQTEQRDHLDPATGYFNMQVAITGSKMVIARDAAIPLMAGNRITGQYWLPKITVRGVNAVAYSDLNTDTFINYFLRVSRNIAASETDLIVPGQGFHAVNNQPRYVTKLASFDSGTTWTVKDLRTPEFELQNAGAPYIETDRSGKWLLFSLDSVGFPSQLVVQESTDKGGTWGDARVVSATGGEVCSVACDGSGRWIVLLAGLDLSPVQYIWSGDDGETWSPPTELAGSRSSREEQKVAYLGNSRWGIVWADGPGLTRSEIEISTLLWGASAVGNWSLY